MTNVRTIANGKSASFPVTGTTTAGYHTAGNEITGDAIKHNEKIIHVDDMLLSSSFVAEIDELKNHYDIRQIYAREMGQALAKTVAVSYTHLTLPPTPYV